MLNHALVTPRAVAAARSVGAPVLAWTVDEPADLERVVAAGVARRDHERSADLPLPSHGR